MTKQPKKTVTEPEQQGVDWNASVPPPPQPPNDDDDIPMMPLEVYTYDEAEGRVRRRRIVHTARERCSSENHPIWCALRLALSLILIGTAIAWKVSAFEAFEKRAETEIFHHGVTSVPTLAPTLSDLFVSGNTESPTA